jgi:polypeptide N-acetylgalactosaminyltransferase
MKHVSESVLTQLHEILPTIPKLKILRSPMRLGLMKTRMLGAANAKGPVLVIMDSHMEVAIGWLPPLLDPIARNPKVITLPGVAVLEPQTLKFHNVMSDLYYWVGGMTWELMYTWTSLEFPEEKNRTFKRSPTMLGAAFVIRKDYFESLGYYEFQSLDVRR